MKKKMMSFVLAFVLAVTLTGNSFAAPGYPGSIPGFWQKGSKVIVDHGRLVVEDPSGYDIASYPIDPEKNVISFANGKLTISYHVDGGKMTNPWFWEFKGQVEDQGKFH